MQYFVIIKTTHTLTRILNKNLSQHQVRTSTHKANLQALIYSSAI